jgi:hypothetical protein
MVDGVEMMLYPGDDLMLTEPHWVADQLCDAAAAMGSRTAPQNPQFRVEVDK